jgi:hypothetical protein
VSNRALEVSFGFVRPAKVAAASSPHVFPGAKINTSFVAENAEVGELSWIEHVNVSMQTASYKLGPCNVNVPTVNKYPLISFGE